jgi:hypothetical protein
LSDEVGTKIASYCMLYIDSWNKFQTGVSCFTFPDSATHKKTTNDSSVFEGTGLVEVSKTSLSQFKKPHTWETALLKNTQHDPIVQYVL